MRKGMVLAVVVLALVMVMTGAFMAGCGRTGTALPLGFYVPSSCVEGEQVQCAIAIPYPLGTALPVGITASVPSMLLFSSVVIPAGKNYIEFTIEVADDDVSGPDIPLVLTASAAGYIDATANFTVVDND